MMVIRKIVFAFLFVSVLGFLSAQEDVNKGDGLTATLEMGVDAFNLKHQTFAASEIRGNTAQKNTEIQYFISNWEFAKDAQASLGYQGQYFGGNFAFKPQITSGSWTFGAKMSGWAQFSFLRLVLGNDIETLYADYQGADEGLMIYGSNNAWINPDNITNSSGLLLQALFDPFSFEVAAGDFSSVWQPTTRIENGDANDNIYLDRFDSSWTYGARFGYKLGDPGKINLSYRISQKSVANSYYMKGADSLEIVPVRADAQVFEHIFGLYGSFYFGNFGLTAGYLGDAIVNLSEYYNSTPALKRMVETGVPVIFRNGLAVNARWQLNEKIVLRTDHAVTFWRDKDYESFNTLQPNWNINLERIEVANGYRLVNKLVMRNGLGASYLFTDRLEGKAYLHNNFGHYSVKGSTPGGELALIKWENVASAEVGLTYKFNANASVYFKIRAEDTLNSRSADLNSKTVGMFVNKVHGEEPDRNVETLDNQIIIAIPIGLTLKIR